MAMRKTKSGHGSVCGFSGDNKRNYHRQQYEYNSLHKCKFTQLLRK